MNIKIINSLSALSDDQLRQLFTEISQNSEAGDRLIRSFCENRSELECPALEEVYTQASRIFENINLDITNKGLVYENYLKEFNLLYYMIQNWCEALLNHKEYTRLLMLPPLMSSLWEEHYPNLEIEGLDLPTFYDIGAFILQYTKSFLLFTSPEERQTFFLEAFRNLPELYVLNEWFAKELILRFFPALDQDKFSQNSTKNENYFAALEEFFGNSENDSTVLNNLLLYEPLIIDYLVLALKLNKDLDYIDSLYRHFTFIHDLKSKVTRARQMKRVPDKFRLQLSYSTESGEEFLPNELIQEQFCNDLTSLIEEYFYSGIYDETEEDE